MKSTKYLLILVTLIFGIQQAQSCSCFFSSMSVKRIVESDLVMLAQVVKKDHVQHILNGKGDTIRDILGSGHFKYQFKIKQLIKGEVSEDYVDVYSSSQGSACGVNYSIDDVLYIFSHEGKGQYFTGLCHQNRFDTN